MENTTPTSLEVVEAFDDFMQAFESFKQANDERLAQLENRLTADVVTTDKVERINAALDEQKRALDRLVLGGRRPQLEGKSAVTATAKPRQLSRPTSAPGRHAVSGRLRKSRSRSAPGLTGATSYRPRPKSRSAAV